MPFARLSDSAHPADLRILTAEIVSFYLLGSRVRPDDLPRVIESVHRALQNSVGQPASEPAPQGQQPSVPIKKSVFPDYIICLEDGAKLQTLKRHLRARYNKTPQEYREKWGLPRTYPMVAPNFSLRRQEMAYQLGLARRKSSEPDITRVPEGKSGLTGGRKRRKKREQHGR